MRLHGQPQNLPTKGKEMRQNDIKARRMKEAQARNPNAEQPNLTPDYHSLRSEVAGLRIETESLRPLKAEVATPRARMADLFFSNSEKLA